MAEQIIRRNFLESIVKVGAVVGLGKLASLVGGCKDKGVVKKEEFTLLVSQSNKGVRYCGMPNEKTFSLSETNHWATNLYYPKDAKQIFFEYRIYDVVSVNSNQITLREVRDAK